MPSHPTAIDWSAVHRQRRPRPPFPLRRDRRARPAGTSAWAAQFEAAPIGTGAAACPTSSSSTVVSADRPDPRARHAGLADPCPAAGLVHRCSSAKARVLFGPGIALDVRFFTPLALGVALALGAGLPARSRAPCESSSRTCRSTGCVDRPAARRCGHGRRSCVLRLASASRLPAPPPRAATPRAVVRRAARSHWPSRTGPSTWSTATAPAFDAGAAGSAYYERSLAQYCATRSRFPAVVQDDFYVVDDDGQLVRPDLAVARSAQSRLHRATAATRFAPTRTMPLDGPVIGFGWRVRVELHRGRGHHGDRSRWATSTPRSTLLAGEHVLEMPRRRGVRRRDGSAASTRPAKCASRRLVVGTTAGSRPPCRPDSRSAVGRSRSRARPRGRRPRRGSRPGATRWPRTPR